MPVTLRNEKGSPLEHNEMDNNFRYVRDLRFQLENFFIPGTSFGPNLSLPSVPVYVGGNNGSTAHTLNALLFPASASGTAECGYFSVLPPSWSNQEVEVSILGASHLSSLPLPRDFRLSVRVYPTSIGEFSVTNTYTFNNAMSSGSAQVVGTFTHSAGSHDLHVGVTRDYEHADDSHQDMYLVWIHLRLVNDPHGFGGGAGLLASPTSVPAATMLPEYVSAGETGEVDQGGEVDQAATAPSEASRSRTIEAVQNRIDELRRAQKEIS